MSHAPKTLALAALLAGLGQAADRYEAEAAIPANDHGDTVVTSPSASGGAYVKMRDGNLLFQVQVATEGYYTIHASYAQPNDPAGKIQNLEVNGTAAGQVSFPYTTSFQTLKAAGKVKLKAGANTLGILKSWGWVDLDYLEITPYVATPFTIGSGLVSPAPSANATKVYGFLRDNFQKKVISGVMTNGVFQNDGKYTPFTLEQQTESGYILAQSGKLPALMGFDFLHGTGLNSDQQWHQGYTRAALSMAESLYVRGGIPIFCWHWMDPLRTKEAFYVPSASSSSNTTFDLTKACTDTTCQAWDESSPEYQAIVADLDTVAGYLKSLSDKGIPVLWRPLHEASGKWFWWGAKGPRPVVALYRLMFQRFTAVHGLGNLIWVWTTDEAGDAQDWYPGDAYVDIVGRDYYYYPRVANHGSLVSSFEKVKEIYGGRKLVALSENGSVPYPDSLQADGAGWSWFMPWYGDYTLESWLPDNSKADWKRIMNHDYVITLDRMPGWQNVTGVSRPTPARSTAALRIQDGRLELGLSAPDDVDLELLSLDGRRLASLHRGPLGQGLHSFALDGTRGIRLVRLRDAAGTRAVPVLIP